MRVKLGVYANQLRYNYNVPVAPVFSLANLSSMSRMLISRKLEAICNSPQVFYANVILIRNGLPQEIARRIIRLVRDLEIKDQVERPLMRKIALIRGQQSRVLTTYGRSLRTTADAITRMRAAAAARMALQELRREMNGLTKMQKQVARQLRGDDRPFGLSAVAED